MKQFFAILSVIAIGATCFLFSKTAANTTIKTNAENPFAIVQLFTSQGCSSCPSADKLLEKLKDDYSGKNVILLSYHVDYWDRLGWKDPFSSHDFTQLQYNYENQFHYGSVYTPQAVVNGKVQFVGSNASKMTNVLSSALNNEAQNTVQLSNINRKNGMVSFQYDVTGDIKGKKLKIALVIGHRETQVKNGENGGRNLSNSNIVVEEKSIDLNKNMDSNQLEVPKMVKNEDNLSLVGYIQNTNLNITGATQKSLK